jgi:hypothetical protein
MRIAWEHVNIFQMESRTDLRLMFGTIFHSDDGFSSRRLEYPRNVDSTIETVFAISSVTETHQPTICSLCLLDCDFNNQKKTHNDFWANFRKFRCPPHRVIAVAGSIRDWISSKMEGEIITDNLNDQTRLGGPKTFKAWRAGLQIISQGEWFSMLQPSSMSKSLQIITPDW